MIIDTHTHLYLPEFPDSKEAVARAIESGVGHMIFPNVDLTTFEPMIGLHRLFPDHTSVAVGLHPTEIGASFRDDLKKTRLLLDATPDAVAVGEIGIDLYWDKTYRDEQIKAFSIQAQWAVNRDLPIIIHCRDGLDEILSVLGSLSTKPRGVMHSFTGTTADVKRIRAIVPDIYFGINGIVTFKKNTVAEALSAIPLSNLLLETDSPYLAPVPNRGRRNESAYIVDTARFISSRLSIPFDKLAEITTANARQLFNLP